MQKNAIFRKKKQKISKNLFLRDKNDVYYRIYPLENKPIMVCLIPISGNGFGQHFVFITYKSDFVTFNPIKLYLGQHF